LLRQIAASERETSIPPPAVPFNTIPRLDAEITDINFPQSLQDTAGPFHPSGY
ncbi:hypothetical protein GWI33_009479, partial [Rhynchophorus ferrugineus]